LEPLIVIVVLYHYTHNIHISIDSLHYLYSRGQKVSSMETLMIFLVAGVEISNLAGLYTYKIFEFGKFSKYFQVFEFFVRSSHGSGNLST